MLCLSGGDGSILYCPVPCRAVLQVAESLDWSAPGSCFAYTLQNHNSVLGIREVALARGAEAQAVRVSELIPAPPSKPDRSPTDATDGASAIAPAPGAGLCGQADDGVAFAFEPAGPVMRRRRAVGTDGGSGSGAAQSAFGGGRDADGGPGTPAVAREPVRLFAFPLECNFSGARLHESLVDHVQRHGPFASPAGHRPSGTTHAGEAAAEGTDGVVPADGGSEQLRPSGAGGKRPAGSDSGSGSGPRWLVLIDAAKACATSSPDLSHHPADIVVLSYYKMFGWPTGLGALLLRRATALPRLAAGREGGYFGGGTVEVALAASDFHRK